MSDFDGNVGLNSELGIPVNNSTYKTAGIGMIIFVIVLLFVVVILTVVIGFKLYNQPSIQEEAKLLLNPISEAVCTSCNRGLFSQGVCTCIPGFEGVNCNVQSSDPSYYDLGCPSNQSIPLKTSIISTPVVNGLSYVDNSCTQACDATAGCIGVEFYTQMACGGAPVCRLLSGVEIPGHDPLVHSNNVQSRLYIKDVTRCVFENRVFVAANLASIPLNYPSVYSTTGYSQHLFNRVFSVDYFPTIAIAPMSVVGIYSIKEFTIEQIPYIVPDTDVYVVNGNPVLPAWWKNRKIYIAYVPKAIVPA